MNREQRQHLAQLKSNLRIIAIRTTLLVLLLLGGAYYVAFYVKSIALIVIFLLAALGFAYVGRIVYKANKSVLEEFERDYKNK